MWRWGVGFAVLASCGTADSDGDGFDASQDCDDRDASIRPGAPETCDGVDNDCDGVVDEDAVDAETFVYADRDGDGIGDEDAFEIACGPRAGFVMEAGDCDDLDDTVFPGADERCNGVDDDCDGTVDEDPVDAPLLFVDGDGDGFGAEPSTVSACELPDGFATVAGDCDDADPDIAPDADERCNGVDDDCDTMVDEDAIDRVPSYVDLDGDGYGPDSSEALVCAVPKGRVALGGDCADDDSARSPGAPEVCDGVDNDCDTQIDDFTVPSLHPTIGDAVAAAPDGSEICVEPGSYGDPFDVGGRSLRIVGVGGAPATTLELADDTLVTGDPATELELRGFTVTGTSAGADPFGRFIELEDTGSPTTNGRLVLEDVHFADIDAMFEAGARGGLVSVSRIDTVLRDVRFTNVQLRAEVTKGIAAVNGGAFYVGLGSLEVDGLDVAQSSIIGASPSQCLFSGGWILQVGRAALPVSVLSVDDLSMDDVSITLSCGQSAEVDGALLDLLSPTGTGSAWSIRDVELTAIADEVDGGSLVRLGRDVAVDGWVLQDNHVSLQGSLDVAAEGLVVTDYELAIDHLTAIGNVLDVPSTGSSSVTRGGLLSARFDSEVVLRWLDVRDNRIAAADVVTGGLVYHNGQLTIVNGIVAGNEVGTQQSTSVRGGLLHSALESSFVLDVENVGLYANRIVSGQPVEGGALWTDDAVDGANVRVVNSSLYDTVLDAPGSIAKTVRLPGDACTWDYNNLFEPSGTFQVVTCSSTPTFLLEEPGYTDVSSPDPRLWDLTLAPGSALVDAGDPAVTDPDGSRADIGAYGGPGGDGW